MINSDRYFYSSLSNCSEGYSFPSVFIRCEIAKLKGEFYKVLKDIARVIGKTEYSNIYELKEKHYFKVANATNESYSLFGENLLTTSVNGPRGDIIDKLCNELSVNSVNKINKLLKNSKYELTDTEEKINYLNESKNDFKGICFAQTLTFLKDTLEKTPSHRELISLSEKHMDGSDKTTVRMQSIQNITNLSTSINLEKIKNIETDKIDWDSFNKELDSLNHKEKELEENSELIDEENMSFNNLCIAELLGLKINCNSKEINVNDLDNMQTCLEKLPTDIKYQYFIKSKITNNGTEINVDRGHAIAYIKRENDTYLRDPNLGLVKIPKGKDAEYIKACLRHIGHDSIFLFKCELK